MQRLLVLLVQVRVVAFQRPHLVRKRFVRVEGFLVRVEQLLVLFLQTLVDDMECGGRGRRQAVTSGLGRCCLVY